VSAHVVQPQVPAWQRGADRTARESEVRGAIPVPCAAPRPYGDIMVRRRRSVIRVLLTSLALARPGGLTSV